MQKKLAFISAVAYNEGKKQYGRSVIWMSTRDIAINIVNMMSEDQLRGFVTLFQPVVSDIPNEETIAAMKEAEALLGDPDAMRFSSVDDLFEELRS